jgi:flagellar assembly factor FliW
MSKPNNPISPKDALSQSSSQRLNIQTSRFGTVECSVDETVVFPEGILGFNDLRRFVLLDDPHDEIFAWMQSCEVPEIAFPILEPELFSPQYQVVLTKHDLEHLQMPTQAAGQPLPAGTRSFSIVTIPDDPTQMTANLKAPIVINIAARMARQVVLQDNHLAIREPIFTRLQARLVQNPQASLKSRASDWGVAIRLPRGGGVTPAPARDEGPEVSI